MINVRRRMSLSRKIANGLLMTAFLAIVAGMVVWGILSHQSNKEVNRTGRRAAGTAEEEKLIQDDELDNLGHIKG